MSKYTTQVRYICEVAAGAEDGASSQGLDRINEIVSQVHRTIIGDYPIFDEAYREVLDCKILKHYYTREICAETVGLWKLWLNNKMNEIMPFYNKLYESELLKFNPLVDVDVTNVHNKSEDTSGLANSDSENNRTDTSARISNTEATNEEETNGRGNSNSTGNKNQTDRYSDTPQGGLNGMQSIQNNTYLTNARLIDVNDENVGQTEYNNNSNARESNSASVSENYNTKGTDKRNSENRVNSTEAYLERISGKRGMISYSKLLKEYRDTFLNIDKMIINDLSDLFFGLWD